MIELVDERRPSLQVGKIARPQQRMLQIIKMIIATVKPSAIAIHQIIVGKKGRVTHDVRY